jgi:Tol biopolymer transport system component
MAVELASPGQSSKLTSLNGKAQLGIMENSVQEKTYFLSDYHADGNEVIYHFGPEKEFSRSLNLELSYDPHLYPDATKLFIFQKEDGQWNPVRSQVYPEEEKIKTHISKLGDFKVAYDANYAGSNIVPSVFTLQQNYPNPFNPTTNIAYNLPQDGQLVITIYNLLGQQVKTIYNGFQYAGSYTITWDATNANGQAVSSGIYFYRIQAGRVLQTKKMTLMR